jgi:hypothetical protein
LAVRHAAGLHLAALHGQDDIASAAIAFDQMEFRADHLVDHGRYDAGRGTHPDAADQHLLLEQVFDVFDRSLGGHGANAAGE